ncbi:MAG: hypothetical protein VYC34_11515 [Planctomycetota bacterium]|nr:hypothetical protein [Planctomycetota bacterium]
MSDRPLILLVGHCGPDALTLTAAVKKAALSARTKRINDNASLEAELPEAALLLINRVLDGDFPAADGVSLIARLRAEHPGAPAAILISNYEDAQRRAEAAGALPGFGKSGALSRESSDRIRAALAARAS